MGLDKDEWLVGIEALEQTEKKAPTYQDNNFPFRSGGRSLGRDLIKVYALEHLFAHRSIDNVCLRHYTHSIQMFFISLKPVELSQIQASAEEFPRGGGDDSPRLVPQN